MSPYQIHEVDGIEHQETIVRFNSLVPVIFPILTINHLTDGFWWIAFLDDEPVAFAGLVENVPFKGVGYFKRCHVMPDHHGHGIQFRMMMARELKARQLGWTQLVSECHASNNHSANNFRRAGFEQVWPEQPWARDSIYWAKALT